jgi:allophanate hydrolase
MGGAPDGLVPELSSEIGLDLESLRGAYQTGATQPSEVVRAVLARIDRAPPEIWIHRIDGAQLVAAARAVEQRAKQGARLPLFGIPFAVKDNIDVAELPTTAACPAYRYVAKESATVVGRLIDAGAILVGKTNMDQLATGLVGVRSPYGIPRNPFDDRFISGGSSSGSAVAVARGLVSFALGTDTAGSGRVPAAFTNTVGLKPSAGLFSTAGVVPACRSLDCVSIFALTVHDAAEVGDLAAGYDARDRYSRRQADGFSFAADAPPRAFRFGVPQQAQREFFGDEEARRLFEAAVERLTALGGRPVAVDLRPFLQAAELLYDGPWIAERLAPFRALLEQPEALLPVIRDILSEGDRFSAVALFDGLHGLAGLRRTVEVALAEIEFLLVPTTPTIYTVDQIRADPRRLNARLGLYTNFVNLLRLCALAVPNGFRADGLPSGITLIGPSDRDARLTAFGAAYQRAAAGTMGATGRELPTRSKAGAATVHAATAAAATAATTAGLAGAGAAGAAPPPLRVAVVGAHLAGQPLNHQLTDLGARLVRTANTSAGYRLFALPGTTPPKPGLVRVAPDPTTAGPGGTSIEIEVWELDSDRFGEFFARVPAPLCLGTIELADGDRVAGFLCEWHATIGARDISSFGGWRRFLASGA